MQRDSLSVATQKHIVDQLIEERAPRLAASPVWSLLGPALRALLGYRKACAMADAVASLCGQAALDHVSDLLRLKTHARRIDRVPATGRCVIVANHPTGIADGVALYDALRARRPDMCFMANADALRICPGLIGLLIPVAWPREKRTFQSTKATIRLARAALLEERPLVIFAAGALSRRIQGVMQDPKWERSAVALARKHDAPLIPVHVCGPYPFLFHLFDRFSSELRDITLFHELLNKTGDDYRLIIGAAVDAGATDMSAAAFTEQLKAYVERTLPQAPDAPFSQAGECETCAVSVS